MRPTAVDALLDTAKGILHAVDLQAGVESAGAPEVPSDVVQDAHVPVEEVLDSRRWIALQKPAISIVFPCVLTFNMF